MGPSPYSNQLNKSQNKSTNIQQTRLPNSDLWTPYSASASKDNVQSKMMPHTLPNIAFQSILHLSQVTQVLPEVTKTQLHAFVLYKFHHFVVAEGTLSRLTISWVGTPLVIPPSIIIILYFPKMLTWQLKEFYLTADMRSIVISLQPQLSFITLPTDSLSLSSGIFPFLKKLPAEGGQIKRKRREVDVRIGRGKEMRKLNKKQGRLDLGQCVIFHNKSTKSYIILQQSHD